MKIELTIEHKDPYSVVLTNEKGDTFGFNPHQYEEFNDFLSGAKQLILPVVSKVERSETPVCHTCKGTGLIYVDDVIKNTLCPDC